MQEIILPSAITVAAVYVVLWQLDICKVLGYHLVVDISFTVIMAMLFAGTYSGAMVAMCSGLFLSILLVITKWLIGYKKITSFKRFTPVWEYYEE